MDVWRYSDWDGFGAEVRESQPHIWRWRDWIVESLNADGGYDRMIVEMLAADEAAPDDPAALRATGFLVRNWYKFNRNVWLDDTVEHTAKAFLGLTLNCARCHDHKYDPIAQTDYYRFRAFFEPHATRTDRVPGQPDTQKDGLPRVYDAEPRGQDVPVHARRREAAGDGPAAGAGRSPGPGRQAPLGADHAGGPAPASVLPRAAARSSGTRRWHRPGRTSRRERRTRSPAEKALAGRQRPGAASKARNDRELAGQGPRGGPKPAGRRSRAGSRPMPRGTLSRLAPMPRRWPASAAKAERVAAVSRRRGGPAPRRARPRRRGAREPGSQGQGQASALRKALADAKAKRDAGPGRPARRSARR